MGAFAPSPLLDAALHARIMHDIVEPVIAGLREEGHEYRGFLYAGLMLTSSGPKVIEFNVRFGDPEAQVVLPMIEGELAPLLMAAAHGGLPERPIALRQDKHVGIVPVLSVPLGLEGADPEFSFVVAYNFGGR